MANFTDSQTRDYYDSYSDVYALIWSQQMHTGFYDTPKNLEQACEDMNAHLAEITGITKDSTVISIGCGRGGSDRFLAGRYGAKVIGIDISERQLEEAKTEAQKAGLGAQLDYRLGSMTELPIMDASADYVWVQEALFHCHEKDIAAKEMYRILKPGGRIIIEDTVLLDPAAKDEVMAAFGSRVYINNILTPEDHEQLFVQTGFNLIDKEDLTTHLAQTYRDIAAYVAANREVLKQKIDQKYWPTLESDAGRARTLKLVEERKLGCAAFLFQK